MKKAVCSFVVAALAVTGLIVAAPSASAAGNYSFSVGDASSPENSTPLNVPVTVAPAVQAGDSVRVCVNTSDGSAVAPGDYTAVVAPVAPCVGVGTPVTFAAGDPTTKFVPVTIVNDALQEGNETFNANLSQNTVVTCVGVCSASISDAQGVQTIVDDDGAPGGFGFASDQSDVEGTGGFGFLDVFVTLNPAPPAGCTQTVQINTVDGTAQAGIDYVSDSDTLIFGPGVGQVDEFTTTIPDAIDEPDETFTWNLSNATSTCGAPPAITDATSTHTIVDDDGSAATPTPTLPSVTLVLDKVGKKKCTLSTVLSAAAAGVTVDVLKNGNLKLDNAAVPGTFKVRRGKNDKTLSLADPQGATLGSPSSQVCPDK